MGQFVGVRTSFLSGPGLPKEKCARMSNRANDRIHLVDQLDVLTIMNLEPIYLSYSFEMFNSKVGLIDWLLTHSY